MKEKIKKILGIKNYRRLVKFYFYFENRRQMLINYWVDYKLFKKYSCCFVEDSIEAIESQIILNYHSIEKGLLFKNTRPKFAKNRVENLHLLLNRKTSLENSSLTQFAQGYNVMCKYYELHQKLNVDISDFYTEDQYKKYNSLLNEKSLDNDGTISYLDKKYFEGVEHKNFIEFSESRRSVRDFTGEVIDVERIRQAVSLALNAPSVCNRQASNIYYISDKEKIDRIMKIQGGFTGYTKNVNQLLIVTTDISYFYTVGERNQFYIDGGIFLMNLMYALHYYKIGNCPANWGKTSKDDKKVRKVVNIPMQDKIICCVPIGVVQDDVTVCYSKRRDLPEILKEL